MYCNNSFKVHFHIISFYSEVGSVTVYDIKGTSIDINGTTLSPHTIKQNKESVGDIMAANRHFIVLAHKYEV